VTVADFMAAFHAYGAIMTALYEREHSGLGRLVEVAMQEAVVLHAGRSDGAIPAAWNGAAAQWQWRRRGDSFRTACLR